MLSLVAFVYLVTLTAALPRSPLSPTHPGPVNIFAPSNRSHSALAAATSWWYPNIDHSTGAVRAYVPDLHDGNGNPVYDYPVYKAVASGDATGFVNAIYSNGPNGDRNNMWLAGQPRVVYLPPGTYTLSSTVYLDTDTVIMGDPTNPPIIKASSGFSGDYLIAGGQGGGDGTGNGGELHFSVMMKNVVLDTTSNTANKNFIALSWRIAQNSALVNVRIVMPSGAHTGIYLGQGSTISVSDVRFEFGNVGFHYSGHQQAQLKNLQFFSNTYGLRVDGGSTISVFAPSFDTVGFPVTLDSGAPWLSIFDPKATNSGTFFTSNVGFPNFMIENLSNDNTNVNNVVVGGTVKVGPKSHVGTYIYGNTYGANPVYQTNPAEKTVVRPGNLAPGGSFPISTAPLYADKTINDVVNLKDSSQNGGFTLHGDGSSDETSALNGAIAHATSQGKLAFLPFGIYRVTNTIYIPPGTELIGEAWSTISGYGSAFQDESNPRPIVKVGNAGETGTAHIQDMRFTVGQQLPGAIIVQVNMAGTGNPDDVAIYNSLLTVGGTRDTEINCGSETNCRAAYLGLHLSSTSSAYIDNFWAWVADHASDDSGKGTRSAAKGGVLVEATKGTWLVGLGSEHFWLYQLAYHNAANVFTSLFQSETNYNQNPIKSVYPPAPFTATSSDPDFSWCSGGDASCRMGVAQFFGTGNKNIFHYGAGSWNFNSGTQEIMNVINSNVQDLQLHGITTHAAHYAVRLPDGTKFGDGSNDGFGGSWGTLVADYPQMAQNNPA